MGPDKVLPYSSFPMPKDFLTTYTSLFSYIDGHWNAGSSTSAETSMAFGNTSVIRETLRSPENQNQP